MKQMEAQKMKKFLKRLNGYKGKENGTLSSS
jgi:hypothetical protein